MNHCLRYFLLIVLLSSSQQLFAQDQRRADVSLLLARHDIIGSSVRYRKGVHLEALRTWRLGRPEAWTPIVAGGVGGVWGRMGECEIQADGRCAPSGSFAVLSALVGLERAKGRRFARAGVGPAMYHGSGATSAGFESRVTISLPVDELVGVGLTLAAARLPSHRGESLTLLSFGGSLTF